MINKSATIPWQDFSDKHKEYIRAASGGVRMAVGEGAVRSGKTIDHRRDSSRSMRGQDPSREW